MFIVSIIGIIITVCACVCVFFNLVCLIYWVTMIVMQFVLFGIL